MTTLLESNLSGRWQIEENVDTVQLNVLYNQAFADKVSNAIVENISFKTSKIDVDKFKAIAAAL